MACPWWDDDDLEVGSQREDHHKDKSHKEPKGKNHEEHSTWNRNGKMENQKQPAKGHGHEYRSGYVKGYEHGYVDGYESGHEHGSEVGYKLVYENTTSFKIAKGLIGHKTSKSEKGEYRVRGDGVNRGSEHNGYELGRDHINDYDEHEGSEHNGYELGRDHINDYDEHDYSMGYAYGFACDNGSWSDSD